MKTKHIKGWKELFKIQPPIVGFYFFFSPPMLLVGPTCFLSAVNIKFRLFTSVKSFPYNSNTAEDFWDFVDDLTWLLTNHGLNVRVSDDRRFLGFAVSEEENIDRWQNYDALEEFIIEKDQEHKNHMQWNNDLRDFVTMNCDINDFEMIKLGWAENDRARKIDTAERFKVELNDAH